MAAEYPGAIFAAMSRGALMSDTTTQGAFVDKLQEELRAALQTLGVNPQGVLATVAAAMAPTAWTAVTFTNSWVDFGGGEQVVQYRKVGDVVSIRGSMKNGTIGAAAFTLPVGFRPPSTTLSLIVNSNNAVGVLTISSSGAVTPAVGVNASFQVTCSFSITT